MNHSIRCRGMYSLAKRTTNPIPLCTCEQHVFHMVVYYITVKNESECHYLVVTSAAKCSDRHYVLPQMSLSLASNLKEHKSIAHDRVYTQ